MTDIDPQTVVDDFNTIHGSVTWVRYWTGTRDDAPKYNLTDGKAWLLGGHTPVVRVRGESSCIALTHVDVLPSQPDDIEDDSRDLPEPAQAAERVRDYVSAFGDGIYDVVDGHPLYGRDLEALGRAGVEVKRLRAELNEALPQITAAWIALDKAGFQSPVAGIAELIDELAAELAETNTKLTEARTYAAGRDNEIGRLVAENARVRQQRDELKPVAEAAKKWRDSDDIQLVGVDDIGEELVAAVDALSKAEATR